MSRSFIGLSFVVALLIPERVLGDDTNDLVKLSDCV
jgi:hypothetical protein